MEKRRQFSADFKAKVAIEAQKEQQTLQELAQRYEVHPNQISSGKQEFLQNYTNVFTKGKKKENKEDTFRLYEKIGRLKVEVDFLKKEYSKACGREKSDGRCKAPNPEYQQAMRASWSFPCSLLLSAIHSKRRKSQADGRDR